MTRRHDDHAELAALLSAHCDGALDDAGQARLEALLRADEDAVAFAVEYLDQHAALAVAEPGMTRAALERLLDDAPTEASATAPIRRIGPATWAAVAAALLIAGLVAVYLAGPLRPGAAPGGAAVATVGVVLETDGVAWESEPLFPGREVDADDLRIAAGRVELLLSSGAQVRLSGPTDMTFDDPMRVALRRGRVEFLCPDDAHGFTVHTPGGGEIVDLGTEFIVDVDERGRTIASVLVGSVRVSNAGGSAVVSANAAYAMSASAAPAPAPVLATPIADLLNTSTVAHYPMRGDGRDLGPHGLDLTPLDAAAHPSPGRAWMSFAKSIDGAQLTRPVSGDEFGALPAGGFTVEAWVRDPGRGGDHVPPTEHCGVFAYRDGDRSRIQLTVIRHPGDAPDTRRVRLDYQRGDDGRFYGDASSEPLDWPAGRWFHLLAIYAPDASADGGATVHLYRTALSPAGLPDEPRHVATLTARPAMAPLTPGGQLTLGGFDASTRRAFGGDIAGLRLLDAPLDTRQIENLYRHGLTLPPPAPDAPGPATHPEGDES